MLVIGTQQQCAIRPDNRRNWKLRTEARIECRGRRGDKGGKSVSAGHLNQDALCWVDVFASEHLQFPSLAKASQVH